MSSNVVKILPNELEKDIREACNKSSPDYCYYCEVLLREIDVLRNENADYAAAHGVTN